MSGYWNERHGRRARLATALAAVILIPVYFAPVLPVWRIHLRAPQYMEGLEIVIYANTVEGDLQNVNILNHYVGMKAISADDFKEFRFLPALLSMFGVWALVAAAWGKRWFAALGWGLFSLSSLLIMADFAYWLYQYGHDLDPRAALKLDAFTPPLIGYSKMGNFHVQSWPHIGGVLLLLAGLLAPAVAWWEWRAARPASRGAAGSLVRAAAVGLALATTCLFSAVASAKIVRVEPPGASLQAALDGAALHDTILVTAGRYAGRFRARTPVTLLGAAGAVLDGERQGTTLTLSGGAYVVADLEIRGSGTLLLDDEAGLHVVDAPGSRIERVRFLDNLHGIYLERAGGTVLRDLGIVGRSGEVTEGSNGNAIHLWYSPDLLVERVVAERHRDGAYVSFCQGVTFRDCWFHHCDRYGLHYMYSQENRIESSRFDHCVSGAAVMFSNRLVMKDCAFVENDDPRAYGLLLRDCSDGVFQGNRFASNTVAVFLDNSHRNVFTGNLLENNAWGLYIYASSERNDFHRNDVVHVTFPVSLDQRVSNNRFRENYWSGSGGYDLDGDRRGDAPHHPVSLFAFLSKRYPDLALFGESPAVLAVASAERLLPALAASEVADSVPAMQAWKAVERGGANHEERPALTLALFGGVLLVGGGGTLWRLRRS